VWISISCSLFQVPGHVLVAPRELRRRIEDMSDVEAADLIVAGKFVQRVVERVYGATASTLIIQGFDRRKKKKKNHNNNCSFICIY
jgi:hypothetical protein